MNPHAVLDAYFECWNLHQGAGLVPLFAPGGTYEDPAVGQVSARALPALVERLCAAFPDLAFERTSYSGSGRQHVVEWVMTGSNQGAPRPGVLPTGKAVVLRGVEVFELGEGGLLAARRYFDREALTQQLGL